MLGASQDEEGVVLTLVLNVADGEGRAELEDAVGSSRGKGLGSWRLQ